MLRIPLTAIPQDGLHIEETVGMAAIQPEGTQALPCREATISGNLEPVSEDYLFQGRVFGNFEGPCDRCLGEAKVPFSAEVGWVYSPAAAENMDAEDDPGESLRPIMDEVIDLGPAVWEEVALALPVKLLCRETCKGLCPQCGKDLNQGPCACAAEASSGDAGLAGLAALLPAIEAKEQGKDKTHAGTEATDK